MYGYGRGYDYICIYSFIFLVLLFKNKEPVRVLIWKYNWVQCKFEWNGNNATMQFVCFMLERDEIVSICHWWLLSDLKMRYRETRVE